MADRNTPLAGEPAVTPSVATPAVATPAAPAHPVSNPGGHSIELKIPAAAEWVRVARLTVAGVASRLQFNIEEIEDIKLAVAEAINNAIQHAPLPAGSVEPPVVTIAVEVLTDGIVVEVKDCGRIHDGLPEESEVAQVDENDLPEGGMGLLLIRTLMDDVTHVSGPHSDTLVRMVKRLPERTGRRASVETAPDSVSGVSHSEQLPPAPHAGGEGTSSAA